MDATWVIHVCYMGAMRALYGRYMGVTWALHGRYTGATWVLHGRYMCATWALHGRYITIRLKFEKSVVFFNVGVQVKPKIVSNFLLTHLLLNELEMTHVNPFVKQTLP